MTAEPPVRSKDLVINDRVTVPARDLSWTASRASGPGGQNVNKVATKVTLRFDLRGTEALTRAQKARLRKLAGKRIDAQGALRINAQAERSQRQNLEPQSTRAAEAPRGNEAEPSVEAKAPRGQAPTGRPEEGAR
jgi:ribosome-associated protein